MAEYSSISVKPKTVERIEALGKKSETWDELLNRLVDELEEKKVAEAPAR